MVVQCVMVFLLGALCAYRMACRAGLLALIYTVGSGTLMGLDNLHSCLILSPAKAAGSTVV